MTPFMGFLGKTLLGAAASHAVNRVFGSRVSDAEAKQANFLKELTALSPTIASGVKHGTQTQSKSRRYVGGPSTPKRQSWWGGPEVNK